MIEGINRKLIEKEFVEMIQEGESWNSLTPEQVNQMVSYVYAKMKGEGQDITDVNLVMDVIYEFLENVPGLEEKENQQKAASEILDKFFQEY